MDVAFWTLLVLSGVSALSLWKFFPGKTYYVPALGAVWLFAWLYFAAAYIFWIAPLALVVFAFSLLEKPQAVSAAEPGRFVAIATGVFPATVVAFWFFLCLPDLGESLKLRPADSPPPAAKFSEVLSDIKLHWEALVFLVSALVFLVAKAILFFACKKRGQPVA